LLDVRQGQFPITRENEVEMHEWRGEYGYSLRRILGYIPKSKEGGKSYSQNKTEAC
jgi:hypothetical protein